MDMKKILEEAQNLPNKDSLEELVLAN